MKAARLKFPLLMLVVAVAGVGLFAGQHLIGAASTEGKAAGPVVLGYAAIPAQSEAPKAAPVAKVEAVQQESKLTLTGSLAADEKADITGRVPGTVQEVNVERGSIVEKDDILVQIDPTDVQNTMNEALAGLEELKAALGMESEKKPYKVEDHPGVKLAQAALSLSEKNHARHEELFRQGALSKALYDQSETEYEATQQRYQQALLQARQLYQSYKTALAKIATLKKTLADTAVRAPFGGYVTDKTVSAGERVAGMPGMKLLTLVKLDPLRLVMSVPQQHAGSIQIGQKVAFTVDQFPDRKFTAEIKFVAPSVEVMTRSMTVEAMVSNTEKLLRPGMFATAEAALAKPVTVYAVPAEAVLKQGDTSRVFVVRDGHAREQVVSVDRTENNRAFITSGVGADDSVITAPAQVHDGDQVG